MTRILLIRHGNTDLVDVKLCGRLSGIPLNSHGLQQSQAVGRRLRDRVKLDAVYSSPLQRATETADAIAAFQSRSIQTDERLTEVDFGKWTGLTFSQLGNLESWRSYNGARALNSAPAGESLTQVQARAWASLSDIIAKHPQQTVAVVSHADVIRALLVLLLGMPLDHILRIEIAPGSTTEVLIGGDYPVLSSLNVLSSYEGDCELTGRI